ncbi:MAG: hypothetical protein COA82_13495 [Alkaliphilus sp.]|nr:DUF86 domain-containing protein [bacterium AH-315-L21]MBN4069723.1 DUF86 domain-containing protein [bacterium AH-315-G05]PHS28506.1 MAG: hypothetical protein COA82_13495 [Alkaliphilus sp.]
MANDVIINKAQIIERCIMRINEEYAGDKRNLDNYTKQDSIILNMQRACEACIDLAMHIVCIEKYGIPQNSRDAFELLFENGIINDEIAQKLKAMVGFRNIAIHNYQAVNIEIISKIIEVHLQDMIEFKKLILRKTAKLI